MNWSPRPGCTAFDVITILRQRYHQKVSGYEMRVEADQGERPPQVFTTVRIHHVVTGFELDPAALEEAIRLSEEKYCSVGAMVQKTASFHATALFCCPWHSGTTSAPTGTYSRLLSA
ncbi:MAG TPA: OsmC family protein [Candidatus Sulfotelmatobacter sp.]|nr:OsmC family protein [Candidatus Sulfotelmatobacter sp.]